MLLVVQAVQVLLLSVAVFVFFLVFGSLIMQPSGDAGCWLATDPCRSATVSAALVQVSVFLAGVLRALLHRVRVTDETYRAAVLQQRHP